MASFLTLLSSVELKELRTNAQSAIDHITYRNEETLLETTDKPEAIKIVLDGLYGILLLILLLLQQQLYL